MEGSTEHRRGWASPLLTYPEESPKLQTCCGFPSVASKEPVPSPLGLNSLLCGTFSSRATGTQVASTGLALGLP